MCRTGIRTFSGKIRYGECGCSHGSKTWHSTNKYRKEIWRCNNKYNSNKKCLAPPLTDDKGRLPVGSEQSPRDKGQHHRQRHGNEGSSLFNTDELEARRDKLMEEAQVVADAAQQNIAENARIALDQTVSQKRYDDLTTRYDKPKQEINPLSEKVHDTPSRKGSVEDFLRTFEKTPDRLPEFTLDVFTGLVDHLTVYTTYEIRATFRSRQEVKA